MQLRINGFYFSASFFNRYVTSVLNNVKIQKSFSSSYHPSKEKCTINNSFQPELPIGVLSEWSRTNSSVQNLAPCTQEDTDDDEPDCPLPPVHDKKCL